MDTEQNAQTKIPDLLTFAKETPLEALELSEVLMRKLAEGNINSTMKVYMLLMPYRRNGTSNKGFTVEELQAIDQQFNTVWKKYANHSGEIETPPSLSQPTLPAPQNSLSPHRKELLRGQPSFLDKIEARLQPQLKRVSLIGEISVSSDEIEQLGKQLGNLFKRYTNEDALRLLEHRYPACMAVFLVQKGIYGYQGGDYWTAVGETLEISLSSLASRLGQVFEKALRRHGLPQFPDLQERAVRYISIILLHGGIPQYCLNDYFTYIVHPSLRNPQYEYLDEETLLNEVIDHASQQPIDKPIVRFLDTGGRLAFDFFQRTRELTKMWFKEQTHLSGDEVGLPQYVIDAFNQWLESREQQGAVYEKRSVFRRPELCFDPWGLGVYLRLPAQPVNQINLHTLEWTVETDTTHTIFVDLASFSRQPETEQILWRVSTVERDYLIQFTLNEQTITWKVDGVDEKRPILFFDPQRGTLFTRPPAGPVWVIYPQGYTLVANNPEAQLTEELPYLFDEWYEYVAEEWDLRGATQVSLRGTDGRLIDIPLRSQEIYQKPELIGGHWFNIFSEPGTPHIYTGALPDLQIPFTGSQQIDFDRWKLTLRAEGESDPRVNLRVSLAELSSGVLESHPNALRVKLSHAEMLGVRPMGRFSLSIRGPLGSDASFDLVFLPEFALDGIEKLYIPDARLGSAVLKLPITTGLLNQIETTESASDIQIECVRPGNFTLNVSPNAAKVNLLITRADLHQRIQVPVGFRLRRLRWQIIKEQAQAGKWSGKIETKPVRWFLQKDKPVLLIDLPVASAEGVQLKLRLLQVDETELQFLETKVRSANRAGRFWRFELAAFKTTVEHATSPILRFELEITGVKELPEVVRLPILSLTQHIQVTKLKIEYLDTPVGGLLTLNWHEKTPMLCRGLQMWSLWRPWQPPLVLPITDEADQHTVLELPYALEPGRYRCVFTILNPWSNAAPPVFPPELEETQFLDVEWIDPELRLSTLVENPDSSIREFDRYLEQVCISQAIGNIREFRRVFSWICEHLIWASSLQVQVIHRLLTNLPQMDKEKEAFGKALLHPNRLKILVSDVHNQRMEANLFSELLKTYTLPKDWDIQTCELLITHPEQAFRLAVLQQLIMRDRKQAIPNLIRLVEQRQLSLEVAADFLLEDKHFSKSLLKEHSPRSPIASDLFFILDKANPLEGKPIVEPGHWVYSDVGWGRIERIEDPETHLSVDNFIEGRGQYRLSVSLHIELSADFQGEKVVLDMRTNQAHFLRARELFVCKACHELVTQDRKIYRSHLTYLHPGNALQPPIPGNVYPLTHYRFERRGNKEN